MKLIRHFALAVGLQAAVFTISPAGAYEHHDSPVHFEEYSEAGLQGFTNPPDDPGQKNKPYFLLFSAEWCHWCHEFAEHTLTRQDVAEYLNGHFINVFIDVDVHNSAYAKYRATGLPYNVFLNPDGSVYYKYAGTLYGDSFLAVIKEVAADAGVGKHALGMEASQIDYTPPKNPDVSGLEALPGLFTSGVLDNFDTIEYGLGKGSKSIQPRTFLYLLENTGAPDRQRAVQWIAKTLERAVARIYDPVEGGFFRYAEKRNWQIPHYEKFSDLNAGAVLLLYKLDRASPSPGLKQAADTTLAYLTSTLFDSGPGTFLSFQIADTDYYFLDKEHRKTAAAPKVMDKVFTDRLAVTLDYLLQVAEYADEEFEDKVRSSLDFLAGMVMSDAGMNRYYELADGEWRGQSGLPDHAYVAGLFTTAAAHFGDARYAAVAAKVVRHAIASFYDPEKKIFVAPGLDNSTDVEYLMELNGLLAHAILELENRPDSPGAELVGPLIAYYSRMSEVLEDRLWDAVEWEFTEAYVPYLRALKKYTDSRPAANSD